MATPLWYAGSAGRFKSILVAPNLSLPVPVIGTPTTAAIAGINSWKLSVTLESGTVVHFENSSYADGSLAPDQIQGGIKSWSVTGEGIYDGASNPNSSTNFEVNNFVVFDLIFSKTTAFGRKQCVGKIVSLDES